MGYDRRLCMGCMGYLEKDEAVCHSCGYHVSAENTDPLALKTGTILQGRYIVGRILGSGGFGITYIGFDIRIQLKVAIKEFVPSGKTSRETGSNRLLWRGTFTERQRGCSLFLREARKMAKIDHVPNIVHIKDTFEENDTAYIIMEYVEGETLSAMLRKHSRMKIEDCVHLLFPVMDTLGLAHQNGIVHRDIAPDNLMIQHDGKVKILDLGAAKDMQILSVNPVQSQSLHLVKHGYSPLEQYDSNGVIGPWTDVYAVCATVYCCIAGRAMKPCFERLRDSHISFPTDLPPSYCKVLSKGLSLHPEDRYQSMDELKKAFIEAQQATQVLCGDIPIRVMGGENDALLQVQSQDELQGRFNSPVDKVLLKAASDCDYKEIKSIREARFDDKDAALSWDSAIYQNEILDNNKIDAGKHLGRLSALSEYIMDAYVLIMFCIFPFYFHDRYFDILESRFAFFWKFTLGISIIELIICLAIYIIKRLYKQKIPNSIPFRPKILSTDIPFTAFLLLLFISSGLSEYLYESWWGNLGRFLGVFFWLMLYLAYIMITRLYHFKAWHLRMFMLSCLFMCMWGITDFFMMDLFRMLEGLDLERKLEFASSIGSIHSYSIIVVMVLALSVILFLREEKKYFVVFDFFVLLIASFACVMGRSDITVLPCILIYGGIPIFAIQNYRSLSRYLIAFSVMLAAIRLSSIIALSSIVTVPINEEIVMSSGDSSSILMELGTFSILTPLCIIVGVLAFAVYIFPFILKTNIVERKRYTLQAFSFGKLRLFRRCYIGFITIAIALLLIAVTGYFAGLWKGHGFSILDTRWFAMRRFIWKASLEYYFTEMSPVQKLFGYFPEGFYVITMDNFFIEMQQMGMGMFDAAHNEYIHLLLTVGFLGLSCYLWFCISCFVLLIKGTGKQGVFQYAASHVDFGNYYFRQAGAFVLSVYLVQAMVNIATCIVLPIMFIFVFTILSITTVPVKTAIFSKDGLQ